VDLALDWNKFILRAEMHTEGFRGPVASRTYGYVGLAAYEAALPGLSGDYQSFASRFPGLEIPDPPPSTHFNHAISMNACYAAILGKFFLAAPENIRGDMKGLDEKWEKILSDGVDTSIVKLSRDFGTGVANAVYAWSASDTVGHMANHHNYDRKYVPPAGDGKWVTSVDFPMPPLLPYWGRVRPFIIHTEEYLAKPLPPYSIDADQPYYRQALEIISLGSPLTPENQLIVEFWNDDHPGLMFTPPGHWLAITNQVIEMEHPSIEKTLETYLKVGFALSDALIATWYSKYVYNLERPESYIQKNIDASWRPYSPTPPFPAYPSGHAMLAAAAAEVLSSMYGDTFKLDDKSHQGFEDFGIKPRCYNSFRDMAKESALSRILMGVHWRMDSEEGLRIGAMIGREVDAIKIEKDLTE
jgi:membrane-associated phospholipid phosphatase